MEAEVLGNTGATEDGECIDQQNILLHSMKRAEC